MNTPIENLTGELIAVPGRTRVTGLRVARLYNLGNYNNEKFEITVEVGEGDDPGKVFARLENIITGLDRRDCQESYETRQARMLLAKPVGELQEHQLRQLPECRETLAKHEAALKRRADALVALAQLGGEREYIDHKDNWEDEELAALEMGAK